MVWFQRLNGLLGTLSLLLVAALMIVSLLNTNLQADLRRRQIVINDGRVTQQVATNIVRDLAVASVNNPEIKSLLNRHGLDVKVNNPQQPANNRPAAPRPATPPPTP